MTAPRPTRLPGQRPAGAEHARLLDGVTEPRLKLLSKDEAGAGMFSASRRAPHGFSSLPASPCRTPPTSWAPFSTMSGRSPSRGAIEVTDVGPVIAHLASCEAWAEQMGVPFKETIERAHQRVDEAIRAEGAFPVTCLGGILVCRAAHA